MGGGKFFQKPIINQPKQSHQPWQSNTLYLGTRGPPPGPGGQGRGRGGTLRTPVRDLSTFIW